VDPDGKGIADVQIKVMLRTSSWRASIGLGIVQTNAEGNFEIRAIPAGHKYSLCTTAYGYGDGRIEVDTEDAVDNRLDEIKLTLNVAKLSVSGIVVDSNDKPVAGASVSCYDENQPHLNTRTDTSGEFTFDGVCSGRVRVTANFGGQTGLYGETWVEGGATDVRVVLSKVEPSDIYMPKRPPSLMRKSLPELKEFKIELPPDSADGTKILVCFWDVEQRPSRRCILELARQTEQLKNDGVIVVAVQASKVDEDILNDWIEKNDVSFPVGMVRRDEEKVMSSWGVRSLPWLILTDKEHIVTAGGFSIVELGDKLKVLAHQ
jgi:hypothetical protein